MTRRMLTSSALQRPVRALISRACWAALVIQVACFDPDLSDTRCSLTGECPNDMVCDTGLDRCVAALPVQCTFQSDARTLALWHLDEGTGQEASDSSGNGHQVLLGSTADVEPSDPTWVTPWRSGRALSFRDGNQYALAMNSEYFVAPPVTIEAWVRMNQPYGSTYLFHGDGVYSLFVDDNGSVRFMSWEDETTSVDAASSESIHDSQWHYIVGTHDRFELKVYVDGYLADSVDVRRDAAGSARYSFGGRPGYANSNHDMDEIRISGEARTAEEIASHYTQCQDQAL